MSYILFRGRKVWVLFKNIIAALVFDFAYKIILYTMDADMDISVLLMETGRDCIVQKV